MATGIRQRTLWRHRESFPPRDGTTGQPHRHLGTSTSRQGGVQATAWNRPHDLDRHATCANGPSTTLQPTQPPPSPPSPPAFPPVPLAISTRGGYPPDLREIVQEPRLLKEEARPGGHGECRRELPINTRRATPFRALRGARRQKNDELRETSETTPPARAPPALGPGQTPSPQGRGEHRHAFRPREGTRERRAC